YMLSKFFLMPVKDEGDPDYRQREEKEEKSSSQEMEKSLTELQSQTNTVSIKQVDELIKLFRHKISDNKEKQTNFIQELDQLLVKRGIEGTTQAANWLKYIFEEKLKAEEAGEILRVIEESEARKKEEKIVRKKSARIKDIKTNLKKYGLSDKKITTEDLTKWDKEEKRKRKGKEVKLSTEELEIDLDQKNQEPNLENEDTKPINKRAIKKKKK
ncbi:10718_t:CDS:2, partial [Paraglomus occultum]